MKILDAGFVDVICKTIEGMTEKARRLFLGRAAAELGYGGITAIAVAAGVSRGVVSRGLAEITEGSVYHVGDRDRRPGAGRPSIYAMHRKNMMKCGLEGTELEIAIDICKVVDAVVEDCTYGDPMTSNKWINTTVKTVADEIEKETGHKYSHGAIKKVIRKAGYSLHKNQKYNQIGSEHPKRNDQFEHIKRRKNAYIRRGEPVISIDTKAKEKVGDFINAGREYRKKGNPRRVLDHDFAFKFEDIYKNGSDFVPPEMMKNVAIVIPNGVYCLNNNTAHVTVGISHDTSEFAADSIRNWWNKRGKQEFPHASRLLILSDGGGSNRSRGYLWKIALQQLSDDLGLRIEMCHYPPGTSKYDPIERRLWSQVTRTWAAKPLKNLETIKGYISATRTTTGLHVTCEINSKYYMTERQKKKTIDAGKEVSGIINSEQIQEDIRIKYVGDDEYLRKWNYIIKPHSEKRKWLDYRQPGVA